MASDKIIELNKQNFAQETRSGDPILVDFWAEWCGPCKVVAPVLDELAEKWDGKVRVGKLNLDDNREVAAEYRVQGIPTFLLFKDGKVVDQIVGAMPKAAFEKFIERHVDLEAAPAEAAVS